MRGIRERNKSMLNRARNIVSKIEDEELQQEATALIAICTRLARDNERLEEQRAMPKIERIVAHD